MEKINWEQKVRREVKINEVHQLENSQISIKEALNNKFLEKSLMGFDQVRMFVFA